MSLDALFQRLETQNEVVLLTANQGLARTLLLNFNRYKKEMGLRAWQRPVIRAYKSYFQEWLMNSELGRSRLLLNTDQSDTVWRSIIAREERAVLLDAAHTAQIARNAESLWHDYLLSTEALTGWAGEETHRFLKWRSLYWKKMEKNKWWPPEYILVAVVEAIEKGTPLPFKEAHLMGFEELTPLQERWLQALKEAGIKVKFFSPEKEIPRAQVWRTDTLDDELTAAAYWAQKHLANNPQARLGIVMPGLEVFLPEVSHHLGCVLAPQSVLGHTPEKAKPFHLSLGLPLMQWAPVYHLFLLWRLLCARSDHEDVEMVLRSPYLWGTSTFLSREKFLGGLKNRKMSRISSFDLRREMSCLTANMEEAQEPSWMNLLRKILDRHPHQPEQAYPSVWCAYLMSVAKNANWLHGKGLHSNLFQLKAAVKEALEEMAKLDVVLDEIPYAVFLSHLKRLWQNAPFQPENQNEPIRVLGILEAMGNEFDAVWVCRMNEGIWPPMGHPNPFIPAQVQQAKQMPHASVQREIHFAQLALAWLLKSAPEVNLSFSQQENGLPLHPSPLLKEWVLDAQTWPSTPLPWWEKVRQQTRSDFFKDWQGLPYQEQEVRGGTSIFEYQAQCPFKAYALKRLWAEAPDEADPAVGAAEHGALLHVALDVAWAVLGDQKTLLGYSHEACKNLIETSVETAWEQIKTQLANTAKIFEISEKERVVHHIMEWLEREKERPPFSVMDREQKYEVDFEGRKLNFKIDRIDKLSSNKILCLDYKTSKRIKPSELTQIPLEKAQLPLYAITMEPPPDVIAYGVINADQKSLIGMGHEDSIGVVKLDNQKPPKSSKGNASPPPSWQNQLDIWRTALIEAFQGYLQGDAARRPLRDALCDYCDARPVCRVDEKIKPGAVTND